MVRTVTQVGARWRPVAALACCGLLLSSPAHAGEIETQVDLAGRQVSAWPTALAALAKRGPAVVAPLVELANTTDEARATTAWRLLESVALQAGDGPQTAYAREVADALAGPRSPGLRERLITLLGEIGDQVSVPALLKLLTDRTWREPARQALQRIAGPAANDALRRAFAEAEGTWRVTLLATLAARHDPANAALLAEHLSGTQPDLIVAALRGLGLGADPKLVPRLAVLTRSNERRVALAAATTLLDMATGLAAAQPEQARRIYLLLVTSRQVHHRVAALQGLGAVGGEEAFPVVYANLDDVAEIVRRAAREALIRLQGEGVSASLRQKLAAAEPGRQIELLQILARRDGPRLQPVLVRLLGASDPAVARMALVLLGDVGDAAAGDVLLDIARQDAGEVNGVAIRAYLRWADRRGDRLAERSAAALAAAARDSERVVVLQGLARLADPATLPLVQRCLPQPALRSAAGQALLAIGARLAGTDAAAAKLVLEQVLALELPDLAERAKESLKALSSPAPASGR